MCWLVAAVAPAAGAAGTGDRYAGAVYAYRVAAFCALVDESVREGFRIEAAYIIEGDHLSAAQAREAREAAIDAVRRQWEHRGRGAQDPRCRVEGRAAAERFSAFIATDAPWQSRTAPINRLPRLPSARRAGAPFPGGA